jgi:hypothetical protein
MEVRYARTKDDGGFSLAEGICPASPRRVNLYDGLREAQGLRRAGVHIRTSKRRNPQRGKAGRKKRLGLNLTPATNHFNTCI